MGTYVNYIRNPQHFCGCHLTCGNDNFTICLVNIKVISRRKVNPDPVRDSSILQRTINKLRNYALIPKGVYHFNSFKEADQWLIKEIVSTRVRLNSKT